ncbi:MAG: HAD family hydrolase [Patulibacter sp.]|nr:HAD family hydrolase [Patulibacter sp.]
MTTLPPIEAVLFDWDGTLMNTKDALLQTYRDVSAQLYGDIDPWDPDEMNEVLQLRAREAFLIVAGGDEERAARVAELFGDAYAVNQESAEAFPGVADGLRRLAALGVRLGVATSKARSRFEADAERAGVRDLLEVAVTGDDVQQAKPAPEPVTAAVDALGLEASRCAYVGDGPNDVLASRAAGTVTIGVEYGFHPDEMRAAGPDLTVTDFAALVDAVARSRSVAA